MTECPYCGLETALVADGDLATHIRGVHKLDGLPSLPPKQSAGLAVVEFCHQCGKVHEMTAGDSTQNAEHDPHRAKPEPGGYL